MPPAARLTDNHTCPMVTGTVPHVGGPIVSPGCPTVLIGHLISARVTDMLICTGPPDVIVKGSPTVIIGGQMAARIGDLTAHGGVIVQGEPTVIIGDSGGGGGGGAGDIASMSLEDKMLAAIQYANLPQAVLAQLGDLRVLVGSILAVSAILGLLALTGFGAVAEVVAGALLLTGAFLSGRQIGNGLVAMADFVRLSESAKNTDDLKRAGARFGDAVAEIGVGSVGTALSIVGARGLSGAEGAEGAASAADSAEASAAGETNDFPYSPKRFGEREDAAVPNTQALQSQIDGASSMTAKTAPGYPDLPAATAKTFMDDVRPWNGDENPGTIYRVIGNDADANGGYWLESLPETESAWRGQSAVQNNWNGDGGYVTSDTSGLRGWIGTARPQPSSDQIGVLPGGGQQIWIPPGSARPGAPIRTPWGR